MATTKSLRSKDRHHILYSRNRWRGRCAKALRNHPYMRIRIPTVALHSRIHARIQEIPCPAEYICDMAVDDLDELSMRGVISKKDNIVRRLDVIIQLFERYNCDPDIDVYKTLSILRWQRQICRSFYNGQ